MKSLKDVSISSKLNGLVAVASGVALLIASIAFVANDVRMMRASKVSQMMALAHVLGSNSMATRTLDDPTKAAEVLSSLRLQPTLEYACVYDRNGDVFASYQNTLAPEHQAPAPRVSSHEFTPSGHLDVYQQIVDNGQVVGTIFLRASTHDLRADLLHYGRIVIVVLSVSLAAAVLLALRIKRIVAVPILELAAAAQRVSSEGDYSIRVRKHSNDELGSLYGEFNKMLDHIQRGERDLQDAHLQLEARVANRTAQLSEANLELSREIQERERAEHERDVLHKQLIEAARRAGMTEIATDVLHNVGNVLNSVNVSVTIAAERLRRSKVFDVKRAADLMHEHAADLGTFIAEDERGRQLPEFLRLLADHLQQEQDELSSEIDSLAKNVEHIRDIVAAQQSFAGVSATIEDVDLAELLDDAVKLNSSPISRHDIEVIREYSNVPQVSLDRPKLLQILVNLISNAKDALVENGQSSRRLTLRLWNGDDDHVRIEVADNGVGIPTENLARIYTHGFTTKKEGHGFGLHSCATAAKEMGGTLDVKSDGPGTGATFVLDLPYQPAKAIV